MYRHTSEGAYAYPALQNVLTRVVREKLGISGEEKQVVRQLSNQVAAALRRELQKITPELTFPKVPERIGSTAEDLKVPGNDECDFLVYVDVVAPAYLELVTPGIEGYYNVLLKNATPNMERIAVSSYLSPIGLHAFLVGKLAQVLRYDSESRPWRKLLVGASAKRDPPFHIDQVTEIVQRSNQAGPNLKLKVSYYTCNYMTVSIRSFEMDFVPCLNIQGKLLVAKCHPSLGHMHTLNRNDPSTLRWRQTMGLAEAAKIAALDKGDGGWSKQVCRLVKYLRTKNSQFEAFPSYIYKTVFLHLLGHRRYPEEWLENKLADRFLDFMILLKDALLREELNHYFLLKHEGVKRNLLRPKFESPVILQVGLYIAGLNRRGEAAYVDLFTELLTVTDRGSSRFSNTQVGLQAMMKKPAANPTSNEYASQERNTTSHSTSMQMRRHSHLFYPYAPRSNQKQSF